MLMPSVFGKDLFDDFFDFPFYDNNEMDKLEDSYIMEMDLPGFSKDDVKVSLKDGYLTVKAAKGLDEESEKKNTKYIRKERYAGECERSFYVGDVKESDIKGEFKHGILTLTIPKVQPQKEVDTTKYIEIE